MGATVVVLSKDRTMECDRLKDVKRIDFVNTVFPILKTQVVVVDSTGATHTYDTSKYDVVTLDL